MSRIAWSGGESGSINGEGPEIIFQSIAPALDTAVVHSGTYAYKATGGSQQMRALLTPVDGRWYYARCWYRFDALPTADVPIMRWYTNGNTTLIDSIILQPGGQVAYPRIGGGSAVSGPSVAANTWFCVEYALRGRVGAAGVGGYDSVSRHNGVVVTSFSGTLGLAAGSLPDGLRFGSPGSLSAPLTALWFDDIAVNDDTGSAQNNFPGVDGKIVHLLPVADSAVGADWKSNTLTAFSPGAYDCLDNRPPTNNALGSGTGQAQARNNVSNVTAPAADLDVTTAAYASVLGAGDTVRVCQHRLWIADSNGSLQHQVAGRIASNPAEAAETAYATPVPAASATTSLNTWASGFGPPTYNPTVNKANGAVLRIGKRSATTDSVGCCYAALQVEYGPPITNAQRFLAVA